MDKVLRYYISEIVSKSVANSQMFNWGEVLARKGLRTTFVVFYRSKEDVFNMTKDTTQPLVKVRVFKFFLIRNLIHFSTFIYLYIKASIRSRKIIFQTRTPSAAPALAIIRFLPNVKVITEVRGIELEQYDLKSISSRLKLLSFDVHTWLALHATDMIFCVSNPLKQLLSERYNLKVKKPFAVLGGFADEHDFFFDISLRNELRKENGLVNKTVLIYSGMLNKPWQLPEEYFKFFKKLMQKRLDLFLVLLTPNIEIAEKLKIQYDINNESIIIKESKYSNLVAFYNMADFGLLFRKNETVNRVASPTKFSEYALCGLPVIISDNIGDYSDAVKSTGFGYVMEEIDFNDQEIENVSQFISQYNDSERHKDANVNKTTYSKQSQINRILEIYNDL